MKQLQELMQEALLLQCDTQLVTSQEKEIRLRNVIRKLKEHGIEWDYTFIEVSESQFWVGTYRIRGVKEPFVKCFRDITAYGANMQFAKFLSDMQKNGINAKLSRPCVNKIK